MKKSNLLMKAAFAALIVALPATALASPNPSRRGDDNDREIRELNRRMVQLEYTVDQIQRNLNTLTDRVDRLDRGPYPPAPPREVLNTCMLIDSLHTKTHMGSGRTRMDAEYNVRRACEKDVHPSYCAERATLKCDDNSRTPPNQVFACLLTDSLHQRTHRGEGKTQVEAEGRARITCQTSVHPSYCSKPAVRCESYLTR